MSVEARRLSDPAWRLWGPYLADRQWATVREDYSEHGQAWESFPHEHARSRAYRWGEDGLAGFCDDRQLVCLSLALWNGRDRILKERLFGLTGNQGNHGEDVKELYWFLDGTPSHAYMRMLYKYPQRAFPYDELLQASRRRGKGDREYELLDTSAFDEDRYFDVFVEYAKAAPEDLLQRIRVVNRGPEPADLWVLPQLTLRNTWSWEAGVPRPLLTRCDREAAQLIHPRLPRMEWALDRADEWLFCDNETNHPAVFGFDGGSPTPKDAFHRAVVDGDRGSLRTDGEGTRVAGLFHRRLSPGETWEVRSRLSRRSWKRPFQSCDRLFDRRRREADAFHATLPCRAPDADARRVQRQALAGLLWTKQFYFIDVERWLTGDPAQPAPPPARRQGRNRDWRHLNNADVISMPDGWEYPWYAAWDLAFHCVAFAPIDPAFAKSQLVLLTREWYMHPNGQLPAYEWSFGDVNPPVHAWAAWRVYRIEQQANRGRGDLDFLERIFHKLLLNFTWWVNRKDHGGNNLFQGGFLGLDNIGVFDRSSGVPEGGYIEQADGTSWMAMYCLNMLRIALELCRRNPVYQDLATKFFEHFLYIAGAMVHIGEKDVSLWDEGDEFFYDVLHVSPGEGRPAVTLPMRLRSMVGLIPLFAVEVLDEELLQRVPQFRQRMDWFLRHRPDLAALVSRWREPGRGETHLLSLLRGHRMKCLLRRALDPREFLSPYGVRSMSKVHETPYVFEIDGVRHQVTYQPGPSDTELFGGNSNWRGPVWFPVNYLLIESLHRFHAYYGDEFRVECPTGSGRFVSIREVADELADRLTRLFLRGPDGRRPCFGERDRLQNDPHFRDHVLFHEYFDGENGRGLGASHQTGWTALVANLLMPHHVRQGQTDG